MRKDITEVISCKICSFEADNQVDLTARNLNEHEQKCDHCAVQATTKDVIPFHAINVMKLLQPPHSLLVI